MLQSKSAYCRERQDWLSRMIQLAREQGNSHDDSPSPPQAVQDSITQETITCATSGLDSMRVSNAFLSPKLATPE